MYFGLWMTPPGGSPTLLLHVATRVSNIAVEPDQIYSPVDLIVYPSKDYVDSVFVQKYPANGSIRFKDGQHLQLFNPETGLFHTLSATGLAGSVVLAVDQVGEA
jgi:hypothetical protein